MNFVTLLFLDQIYWPLELLIWSMPFYLLTAGLCLVNRHLHAYQFDIKSQHVKTSSMLDKLLDYLMLVTMTTAIILAEIGFIWLLVDNTYLIIILAVIGLTVAVYYHYRPANISNLQRL